MTTCPTLVGETDVFLGRAGPHILPDHSELLFGNYNNTQTTAVHRFAYPALGTAIETFNVSTGMNMMCVGNDGTLYWVTNNGEFYRRADPTSAGTDVLMIDLGIATAWSMCWSPSTSTIFAVRHDTTFEPQIWEIDPADDSGTLRRTAGAPLTSATGFYMVATPLSIWFVHAISLYRYHIASTLIDGTVITTASNEVAATNDGKCLFMSVVDTVSEVSVVDEAMTPAVLDCPLLIGGEFGFAELNGGVMDPTGQAFAVFSMYSGGSAAGDEIWTWMGGWTVGRVSWGSRGSWH